MKQNYSICGKKILIESELPLTEHENFSVFAVEEGNADIKITYSVAEKLPDTPVNTKKTPIGAVVSWEGEKVFRHSPMGVAEGALSCYKISDTSESQVYFTDKSYGVMSDFRYMWNSVSLSELFLPYKILLIEDGGKAQIVANLFIDIFRWSQSSKILFLIAFTVSIHITLSNYVVICRKK